MVKISFLKKVNFYFFDLLKKNLKINIFQIVLSFFISFLYLALFVSLVFLIKNIIVNKDYFYILYYENYSVNLFYISFFLLFLIIILIIIFFKIENHYQKFLIRHKFLNQKYCKKFLPVFFRFKLNIMPNVILFIFCCIILLIMSLKFFLFLITVAILFLLILKNKKKIISNFILKKYEISAFNIQFYSKIINLFILLTFLIILGFSSFFINLNNFLLLLLLMIFSFRNIILHFFRILRSKNIIEEYFDFKASKFKNI